MTRESLPTCELRAVKVKRCFSDPLLKVMTFLNEAALEYPEAISFAPGRPLDSLLHVEDHLKKLYRYVAQASETSSKGQIGAWQQLGQYGRTSGMIREVIAKHLELDEGIRVDTDSIVVTVGAQEAMAIVLATLFDGHHDILLASDPTYIGITGLARVLGIRVLPVASSDFGLEAAAVDAAITAASKQGRVRALYDIPDFNNPLGTSLPVATRLELLEVCRKRDVLIIEDNPYGMFAYDGPRAPTLKSLDRSDSVLYIGSFSKTICPGLRLGYLVATQRVFGTRAKLSSVLSQVKSLVTVNTSPLVQAIAAGLLSETGGSLEPIVAPKRRQYHAQRNAMFDALARAFDGTNFGVSWNRPAGGFFMTVRLPFPFGPAELRQCALDHNVVVCPMRFFSLASDRERDVRLSFSCVDPDRIAEGVERFAVFVGRQLEPTS